jgi:hypothetical protein
MLPVQVMACQGCQFMGETKAGVVELRTSAAKAREAA